MDCPGKPQRPSLGLRVGKPLEYPVLQLRQHQRDAGLAFRRHVVGTVIGATDGATFAVFPVVAFDDLVRRRVCRDAVDEHLLDGGIVVVGEHGVSPPF